MQWEWGQVSGAWWRRCLSLLGPRSVAVGGSCFSGKEHCADAAGSPSRVSSV